MIVDGAVGPPGPGRPASEILVDEFERRIARRYDLELALPLRDFLLQDSDVLATLADAAEDTEELVLLREGEDALDFTLYLSHDLCRRAARALARRDLANGGLDAVCTLIEGVSHGVCLLWHARHGRQLSALDLELQAEIDKYLLLSRDLALGGALHRALFEQVSYAAPADTELGTRYRRANGGASRYCRWLERRFPARRGGERRAHERPRETRSNEDHPGGESMVAELARFYRLSGHAKRRRIARCRPHG